MLLHQVAGKRGEPKLVLLLALAGFLLLGQLAGAQRENDDDFDDSGFDDSGYNNPNRDTESSNQNPNSYSPVSEDDIDDDDVDETHMSPQVAESDSADQKQAQQQQVKQEPHHYMHPEEIQRQQYLQQQQQAQAYQAPQQPAYYANVAPQRFYAPPNSVLLSNVSPGSLAPGYPGHRFAQAENDVEDIAASGPRVALIRHKRSKKYIGPVYTYVKTDKHARYKWGVKHKVGKHHG